MPAYCFFDNLEVNDLAKLKEYKKRVAPVVQKFGGRYIVMGGKMDIVEGEWQPWYPVIIEFPSYDQAMAWYQSEEYKELKALRHTAVNCNAVFMEGV